MSAGPCCLALPQEFAKNWLATYDEKKTAKTQRVNIICIRRPYSYFSFLFTKSLRSSTPKEVAIFTHAGSEARLRELMPNLAQPYFFIVDAQGRVRWKASAQPGPGELDVMGNCLKQLS
jgi:hypothetical protein